MFVGDTIPWWRILQHHRWSLGALLALSVVAAVMEGVYGIAMPVLATPFAVVGGALAILLAFRNGAAYDRWWEGRKLWGGVVNVSRSLLRQIFTYVQDPQERDRWARLVAAFAHGLRCTLRGIDPKADYERLLPAEILPRLDGARSHLTMLGMALGDELGRLHREGRVDAHATARIDTSLSELVGYQGGLERIAKTPLPTAYRFFTQRFIRVYALALPFGLAEHLGWLTIVVCFAVGFVFLVLPTIGELIEMPFGTGPNGLPLDTITRNIEVQLLQAAGHADLPPDWPPSNGVLT
jgi:putative membrane protein